MNLNPSVLQPSSVTPVGGLHPVTPTPAPPRPTVAKWLITKINPNNPGELEYALSPECPATVIGCNVTPAQLRPSEDDFNPDPYEIADRVVAAKKKWCPIVVPLTSLGDALPAWFDTPFGWVYTPSNAKLPRGNDPYYVDFMMETAYLAAASWSTDPAVACVRVGCFSVDTCEPVGYGNGSTSGWKALQSQLMGAVTPTAAGGDVLPGYRFTSKGDPILDGTPSDSFTAPYLDILTQWRALEHKGIITWKFPNGGQEDGFRKALIGWSKSLTGMGASNTGANTSAHADFFAEAEHHRCGWTGMTFDDPDKLTGLTGAALRLAVVQASVPLNGPPIHYWQGENRFYRDYPDAVAWLQQYLVYP